jgi:uncharacterized protein (DUF433 family)
MCRRWEGMETKTVVNAQKILGDIRSGLSDSVLMAKYNLSPRGLERLLLKLAQLGAIKRVNAAELLKDIRSGITNSELMIKHKLSKKALKRVLEEMTDVGIHFFKENSGPREKLRIKTVEIVGDIRSGMTELEIMNKYGLSSRGLQSAFWKLVRSGALTWEEILNNFPNLEESVTLQLIRKNIRSYPILSVKVYEENNPQNQGKLRDLSETGLGITGLEASEGEKKKIVLVPDEFMDLNKMALQVICRWFRPDKEKGLHSAGFQIQELDDKNAAAIRELVQLMTLTFE